MATLHVSTPDMPEHDVFDRLFQIMEHYRKTQNDGPVVAYHSPAALREKLSLGRADRPQNYDALFDWVETYLKYAVKTGHKQFWNRMWADANLPAMIGEVISTIAHTSACTFESAPVSTEMEKYLIDEFLSLAGFHGGEGQMTTGSSNGNLVAMMAARHLVAPNAKRDGLFGTSPLVAFVNAEAHYSMDKAVNLLGIGTDNLVKVPVDDHGRMRLDALEQAICDTKAAGKIPFFIGTTAATTVRGAYDPVDDICTLRDRLGLGLWVHVDGAWGGTVFLSEELSDQYLSGLDQADSFTFDFHKMHGIPMVCNFLLINNRAGILQATVNSGNDDYIFRGQDNERPADLGALSLQCGRHVDILKLFLSWKFYGRAGFVARIERFLEKAAYAEAVVRKTPELQMLVPRESFNINFTYRAPDGMDEDDLNRAIRQRLYESGTAMVGLGTLEGRISIRLLIANDAVENADIDAFFQHVLEAGNAIIAEAATA
ncbi:MAG: pyridoxal-dependent decarboxylase [Robiginitomaculum sp.]|nr:pyridoxal-dependent decarboxylase [Robiginitomaculum sp.]MDQ7076864.1 pyridoxal-dependent decarboxylase [Robiginitomaculum sp.]